MIRTRPATVALMVGLLAPGGCTSGGSVAPSAPPSTGSTPSQSSSSSTAPSGTFSTSCAPGATKLTYHRSITALVGSVYVIPPGGHKQTPTRLPLLRRVRAQAPGLGSGAGLVAAVEGHWHVHVAGLGSTTQDQEQTGSFGLPNRTKKNKAYAVFAYTHLYYGTFSSSCSGAVVNGQYTTFGSNGAASVNCADPARTEVQRLGLRLCS